MRKVTLKILKIVAWIASGIVLLILLVILLINIPSVQNYVIDKITATVSSKTNSIVSIGKVGISFPKSVFLREVFLNDQQKDTLLYAGEIAVDIDMFALIKGDVSLNKVYVDELIANIRRADNDSLFNFSFILNSFASNNTEKVVKAQKDSSTASFSVAKVELNNIHLLYDDKYNGMIAKADFNKLEIKANDLDLKNLQFNIDDFLFSNAKLTLTISKKDTSVKNESPSQLPVFEVKNLDLEKIDFKFLNIADSQFVSVTTDDFILKKSMVDLNTNLFSVDKIESDNTTFIMQTSKKSHPEDNSLHDEAGEPIHAMAKEIKLQNTIFRYDNMAEKKLTRGFDPDHIHFSNLNLSADDVKYSEAETHAVINKLSFTEGNGFALTNLSTEVKFTPKEAQLKNLDVESSRTRIKADLLCGYSSLSAFKDSLQNVFVAADFSRSYIDPKDVLYFAPQLSGKPFFMEHSSAITIQGDISGEIKKLKSRNLMVDAGKNTHLTTSFQVNGLPDMETAFLSIPDLILHTTQADLLENFPDSMIPNNIQVPSEIWVNAKFMGTLREFNSELALNSSFGKVNASVRMAAREKYEAQVSVDHFNIGGLIKNEKAFGMVSLTTQVKGSGLKKETVNATIHLNVSTAQLNSYNYTNLELTGIISDQQFKGEINLNDSNIALEFNGTVGIKTGDEQFKFSLDLKGANLQKLNITTEDIRIAARIDADLKGTNVDNMNGKAGITKIILVKAEKTYALDSLLFASINEKGKSEMNVTSALIGIKFNGSVSPGSIIAELKNHINQYFPIGDSSTPIEEKNNFRFEVALHNHPIISEVLLPSLTEFEPGIIEGSFDAARNMLDIKATIFKIRYGTTLIRDAELLIKSDSSKLRYSLVASEISNNQLTLDKIELGGVIKENKASVVFNTGREEKARKLAFNAEITSPKKGDLSVQFDKSFTLGGTPWTVKEDNQLLFPQNQSAVIHFAMTKENEDIAVNSTDPASTEITFKDFQLINLSRIIQKDTAIIEGKLNGSFTFLHEGAFISNAQLSNLIIRSNPLGDLSITAKKSTSSVIALDVKLKGNDNNLSISGAITPKQTDALNLRLGIRNVSMKSIEAFSFGQLKNSSGNISGDIDCRGSFSQPLLNGQLHFADVVTTPAVINNPLRLSNETILIKNAGMEFSSFTIRDKNDHTAKINGNIKMVDISNPVFNLNIVTDNFLAMNSTAESKQLYYGTLIIDSKIKITGTPAFPKINANIKLSDGSYFTFAVPETKLTADKGEGVVEFTNARLNPILTKKEKSNSQKSDFKNIDLVSEIRVDKNATLKLLIDPTSGDSLVVRGEAALSFALDPSGKVSMTGRYELNDGSYLVSLQDLIKKKFEIQKGGTIIWNGDPLDADIDMRAIYTVRTSPIDLVANEIPQTEQNSYKERLPFEVILSLKGQLLKPDISFEIQLASASRGALGGAVNAKLTMLNEDESELNKQVFALLVLNRFIQEDPLTSAGGSGTAEGVARESVGRLLSQQLNKLSSTYIKGVDLNFDVQSYDDLTSGKSEGRTQVEIGIKKQFNPRFSVQVGGSVDVEGERTQQNNASELTGDILVEYKLTDDGRYRLKGFRHTEYEGVIEGQITETGAGILYTRDFDKWNELFKKSEKIDE